MSLGAVFMIALGGSLAFGGAAWAVFPSQMRRLYTEMFALGDTALHRSGLVSVAIGVALILIAVQTSRG